MKRMYQIIKSETHWSERSVGWLLVLLSMCLGGLVGAALAVLVPGMDSQTLNFCGLGLILGFIWSLIALLNV